jgi:hypothetical protein
MVEIIVVYQAVFGETLVSQNIQQNMSDNCLFVLVVTFKES